MYDVDFTDKIMNSKMFVKLNFYNQYNVKKVNAKTSKI